MSMEATSNCRNIFFKFWSLSNALCTGFARPPCQACARARPHGASRAPWRGHVRPYGGIVSSFHWSMRGKKYKWKVHNSSTLNFSVILYLSK
ncbi:hypothetical protein Taro_030375 [Colocasia esculenta]|uniref:Uncharacterized protein n=1 Tax=Colocasia esculenta TaxID=4460 RepID=A0A843VG63_COLES|nr:hypothetical protein [Colocasia esculenta]